MPKAMMLLQAARDNPQIAVDEILFNSVLDGCARIGDYNGAMHVFDDMLNANISPSCVTFSILVRLILLKKNIKKKSLTHKISRISDYILIWKDIKFLN